MDAAVRSALEFYRDAWAPKTSKKQPGLTWHPKEELLDDCGQRAIDALRLAASPTPFINDLVTEYLAAIDAEPEKDIWDTWDGKPAEGAEKTSSDFAWEAHGARVFQCLERLRSAFDPSNGEQL